MNISEPTYTFCKENKSAFLEFLKVANEQKTNKFCNLNEYNNFRKLFPLEDELKNDLQEYISRQNTVIDITQSDEEYEETAKNVEETEMQASISFPGDGDTSMEKTNRSTMDDLTASIKENLEIQKCVSPSVISQLVAPNVNLENIFTLLSEELNVEEVLHFGVSLLSTNIRNDLLLAFFIKYLLIKMLNLEYSDQLQGVINEFSMKYPEILKEGLIQMLTNSAEKYSKIFLQYMNGLNSDFKKNIFRPFIFSCSKLNDSHIGLIEILLTSQVEYDSLNKLTEVMSFSADEFTMDKSFGKLLIKVIKFLGKNVGLLEQPLKHIIGTHRSIWKSKIQKTFDECLQDSLLLSQSQSFR